MSLLQEQTIWQGKVDVLPYPKPDRLFLFRVPETSDSNEPRRDRRLDKATPSSAQRSSPRYRTYSPKEHPLRIQPAPITHERRHHDHRAPHHHTSYQKQIQMPPEPQACPCTGHSAGEVAVVEARIGLAVSSRSEVEVCQDAEEGRGAKDGFVVVLQAVGERQDGEDEDVDPEHGWGCIVARGMEWQVDWLTVVISQSESGNSKVSPSLICIRSPFGPPISQLFISRLSTSVPPFGLTSEAKIDFHRRWKETDRKHDWNRDSGKDALWNTLALFMGIPEDPTKSIPESYFAEKYLISVFGDVDCTPSAAKTGGYCRLANRRLGCGGMAHGHGSTWVYNV